MLRHTVKKLGTRTLQGLVITVALHGLAGFTSAQTIINQNISPYLHLTRNEFRRNSFFPVYQSVVRPQIQQRTATAWRPPIRSGLNRPSTTTNIAVRPPVRTPVQNPLAFQVGALNKRISIGN